MAIQPNTPIPPPIARTQDGALPFLEEGGEAAPTPATVHSGIPRAWDGRLAFLVTNLCSPPVLAPAAMALVAATISGSTAWMWAGFYVGLAILLPLLYVVWLVCRGTITDLDVQLREQRTKPLIFTILCAGLAWLTLAIGAAPSQMVVLAGALCLQALSIFLVTLRWKISVHSAAAAGAATVAWFVAGTLLPLLIVPVVAWSRVRLRRHTLLQTIAGSILGLAIYLGAFLLIKGG